MENQPPFTEQPMMSQPMNPGLDSAQAVCSWTNCHQRFQTPIIRDQHVHTEHFHPQIKVPCSQNDCAEFSGTDLPTHLKRNHDIMLGEEACFVENCSFDPNGDYSLEQHVDQKHSTPVGDGLFCGWAGCNEGSIAAPDEFATHLQVKHEVLIWASHECQWKDEGSHHICGERFTSPKDLQEHTKTAHLAGLSKKVGYICRWDGCDRASKTDKNKLAFAQRGKLERHMQSHTKCKEPYPVKFPHGTLTAP